MSTFDCVVNEDVKVLLIVLVMRMSTFDCVVNEDTADKSTLNSNPLLKNHESKINL